MTGDQTFTRSANYNYIKNTLGEKSPEVQDKFGISDRMTLRFSYSAASWKILVVQFFAAFNFFAHEALSYFLHLRF